MPPGIIFRSHDGNESLKAIMSQDPLEIAESLIEIIGKSPELDSTQIRVDYIDDLLPITIRKISECAISRELGVRWRWPQAGTHDEPF